MIAQGLSNGNGDAHLTLTFAAKNRSFITFESFSNTGAQYDYGSYIQVGSATLWNAPHRYDGISKNPNKVTGATYLINANSNVTICLDVFGEGQSASFSNIKIYSKSSSDKSAAFTITQMKLVTDHHDSNGKLGATVVLANTGKTKVSVGSYTSYSSIGYGYTSYINSGSTRKYTNPKSTNGGAASFSIGSSDNITLHLETYGSGQFVAFNNVTFS